MPGERVADLLGFQLGLVIRKLQKTYEAAFAPHGITPSQALALDQLWQEDGLQPRDLSERAHLDPTSVNWLVTQLERAGLLERRRDAVDRRGVRLWLTPAGRELAEKVLPEVQRLHHAVRAVLLQFMIPQAVDAMEQGLAALVRELPEGEDLLTAVMREWDRRLDRLRRLVEDHDGGNES